MRAAYPKLLDRVDAGLATVGRSQDLVKHVGTAWSEVPGLLLR
jgi:hypothetical protein